MLRRLAQRWVARALSLQGAFRWFLPGGLVVIYLAFLGPAVIDAYFPELSARSDLRHWEDKYRSYLEDQICRNVSIAQQSSPPSDQSQPTLSSPALKIPSEQKEQPLTVKPIVSCGTRHGSQAHSIGMYLAAITSHHSVDRNRDGYIQPDEIEIVGRYSLQWDAVILSAASLALIILVTGFVAGESKGGHPESTSSLTYILRKDRTLEKEIHLLNIEAADISENAQRLFRRANLMLIFGLIVAASGVGVFSATLPNYEQNRTELGVFATGSSRQQDMFHRLTYDLMDNLLVSIMRDEAFRGNSTENANNVSDNINSRLKVIEYLLKIAPLAQTVLLKIIITMDRF